METQSVQIIVDHLRRLVPPPEAALSDGQLLGRYVTTRDQEAFAVLVRRHGPMVLGVCRRVLRDLHDAEDAFQAAFFILARKAASVVKRASLSAWLHAVAYRAALEARTGNVRRRTRERSMPELPQPQVAPAEAQDWRPLLDDELSRLPEKHRATVILVDLEGRTRKEVARLLGVPEGTVNSRLTTARQLLAQRLARRGVALSGGMLSAALAANRAMASVPLSLALATAKAALQFAVGQTAALALPAAALTKGVFRAMLLTKLKLVVASLMVATVAGLCGLAYQATVGTGIAHAAPAEAQTKGDLDALRKENDMLRRSLQLALDRIEAQEAELKSLRPRDKATPDTKPKQDTKSKSPYDVPRPKEGNDSNVRPNPGSDRIEGSPKDTDPTREKPRDAGPKADDPRQEHNRSKGGDPSTRDAGTDVEEALKAVRNARDDDAKMRAMTALKKALKKLDESIHGVAPVQEKPGVPIRPGS
jgi:RNA polymerase sigma factor (sigma-70 family)